MTSRPVRIITDSTADLPADVAQQLGIVTVPISVNFGARTFLHGIDIDSPTFYQMLAGNNVHPTTSAPPPAWFKKIYAEQLDAGYDIVSVHLASTLSSMYDGAATAARQLRSDRIVVIDSGQLTLALGLLAQICARQAMAGVDLETLSQLAKGFVPRLRLAGILLDLDYVHRGGRISQTQAVIGTLLHIRGLFEVVEGDVRPAGRIRSMHRALDKLIDLVAGWGPVESSVTIHANNPDLCQQLERRLTKRGLSPGAGRFEGGPAVVTHVGPGAVGVAGILKPL